MVLPADHIILDHSAFYKAILQGKKAAEQGKLVTFGVVADQPETGYGYILRDTCAWDELSNTYPIKQFVEKPDKETAEQYIASGEYYWNSGMFMFRASSILSEMQNLAEDMLHCVQQSIEKAQQDNDFIRLDKESFALSPADSIDYAIMEKTTKAVVVPLDAQWNDIGSWPALWEIEEKDGQGNVLAGDVLTENVKNSYIHAEKRLIAAIGLEDIIIVETADAVLVADKHQSQDVKKIVAQLKQDERYEAHLHQRVLRPWGSYETLDECERFKVKRIIVKPGASLSLQLHHHRAEHWVVVKGTAKIVHGEQEQLLTEDQSTYIPLGVKHRLENVGVIPLEIIEVQTGSYLGEDDIVRFSDHYGRVQ